MIISIGIGETVIGKMSSLSFIRNAATKASRLNGKVAVVTASTDGYVINFGYGRDINL